MKENYFINLKNNADAKILNERTELSRKCPYCGHSIVFPAFGKEKKICSWCKKYVYKNKKIEFKEKLKGKLKK